MEIDSGLTLYDMNKQAYSQEKALDVIALHIKVNDMITDLYSTKRPYWMLLCRERNDYTIFTIKEWSKLIKPPLFLFIAYIFPCN